MKIKWKVMEAPTGPWRSFERRGWPQAYYEDDRIVCYIKCEDDYVPKNAKTGNHRPLRLHIYDYSKPDRPSLKVKKEFQTLQEVKDALPKVIESNPHVVPKPEV